MEQQRIERVAVVVETGERTFRGYLYRPLTDSRERLSDYLNNYSRRFLCLSNVAINDRGQTHRPGEKREFVAISTAAITYVAPLHTGEQ